MFSTLDLNGWQLLALCIAAFAAGWLDAIGGGGGLIQLPVVLLVFPSNATAMALGTSKLSAIVGTTAAAANYARSIPPPMKTLRPMMLAAFAGSAAGAVIATKLDTSVLRPAIVVMLIGVWLLTWRNPASQLRAVADHETPTHSVALPALIGGFIGLYDGAIGPGTGVFLLISLVQIFGFSFLRASATAKFVNVATNLAAIIIFGFGGHIAILIGAMMGIANLSGGYLGSKLAIAQGSEFVRRVMLLVVGALIIRLGLSLFA